MCGVAGILNLTNHEGSLHSALQDMLSMLTHRGPEQAGFFENGTVGLAHSRLSIIGVSNGLQPIANEDGTIWAICNGEFFNFVELRESLLAQGHTFRTDSDTEVLVHLYEEIGWDAVGALNGQFAFALWDGLRNQLWLGRDRLGVRPLFYTTFRGQLLFASEIKALLACGVPRQLERQTLSQVFTTWSPLPGHTILQGVHEVLPGHTLCASPGSWDLNVRQYWRLSFPTAGDIAPQSEEQHVAHLRSILTDAVRIRLRADVPIGTYLSGGLDSTLVTSLAQSQMPYPLHTFSVAFQDSMFDERAYQYRVARELGTNHHVIECEPDIIRDALPETLWHTEVPLLRLAPVPMYLLSRVVHDNGLKVMLSGEGADEFFGGYDIFKEALIRRYWAREPSSRARPKLLRRIYPHIGDLQSVSWEFLRQFFGQGLTETHLPYYSHLLRWQNTRRTARLFSREVSASLAGYSVIDEIAKTLPGEITAWETLAQAQYIEITTFLSTYLLASQGDRVAMAHAVECRHPFLDHRTIAVSLQIPAQLKLRALRREKHVLRLAAQGLVPEDILARPKQPYRAPIRSVFGGRSLPEYAEEILTDEKLRSSGIFSPEAVGLLIRKVMAAPSISEVDQMAFMGVLTTQLIQSYFVDNWYSHFAARNRKIQMINVRDRVLGDTVVA